MFLGTYHPRLDDKGRLILPAKFREAMADGLVITRGQERCLYVWSTHEFARLTERMAQAPVTDKRARDYVRMFYAGGWDEVPDTQGRVRIPDRLRDYASLSRDCVVIGAMNRLEIWDAVAWDSYSGDAEQAFAELSEEVLPGVF